MRRWRGSRDDGRNRDLRELSAERSVRNMRDERLRIVCAEHTCADKRTSGHADPFETCQHQLCVDIRKEFTK